MKVYTSSVLRPFGSLVRGVLTMCGVVGILWAFAVLFMYGASGRWRPEILHQALTFPLFLGAVGVAVLFGVPVIWASFGECRGSYRMAPMELEIWTGILHKKMVAVKYQTIADIRLSQGPLMQLLGTYDLTIRTGVPYAVDAATLRGVRNGMDLRLQLLERRDTLQSRETDEG